MGKFTADGFVKTATTPGGADGLQGNTGGKGSKQEEVILSVSSESAVKVAVAVRPLLDHEKGCSDIVQIFPPCKIHLPKKLQGPADAVHPFEYDRVVKADEQVASKHIFALVLPVVERFCQGFNGTVLAYGQTGSGKTYTMGTAATQKDLNSSEPRGVVPRTLLVLYSYIEAASKAYDISLKVQYVEIYNEQVVDLLSDQKAEIASPIKSSPSGTTVVKPAPSSSRLDIRERSNGEVFVDGAVEIPVSSREEIARVLDQGNTNRSVASHKMNSESSRSHAIVTLVLEQRAKPDLAKSIPQDLRFLRSKLHLVDLAGSERQKDTGATGDRFSEGVNINKGLLELGNVINALTEGKKRTHVPYRNSKLTRLLADSLGGNSETLFLACVSPADRNHEQTLNTLRYAARARNIRNNLRQNKMTADEELEYLRDLVQQLQQENSELKAKLDGGQGKAVPAKSGNSLVVTDF